MAVVNELGRLPVVAPVLIANIHRWPVPFLNTLLVGNMRSSLLLSDALMRLKCELFGRVHVLLGSSEHCARTGVLVGQDQWELTTLQILKIIRSESVGQDIVV